MNMVASTNITVKLTVTTAWDSWKSVNLPNPCKNLKEEGLEVVGHVGDDDEEQGGDVDGEDGAQQSPGITDIWFLNVELLFWQLVCVWKPSKDHLYFNITTHVEAHISLPATKQI